MITQVPNAVEHTVKMISTNTVTELVSRSSSVTSGGGSYKSKYRESIPSVSKQTENMYGKCLQTSGQNTVW